MAGDCWFVLALKLSWQTVWPNLTPLLDDTQFCLPQFSLITFWLELNSPGRQLSRELHQVFPLLLSLAGYLSTYKEAVKTLYSPFKPRCSTKHFLLEGAVGFITCFGAMLHCYSLHALSYSFISYLLYILYNYQF